MTQDDFIKKIKDAPWVNRGDSFGGVDCYGLYKLYAENVLNKEMPEINGYKEDVPIDFLHNENIEKHWHQVGHWKAGCMVTFYNLQDKPIHIGVCIGEMQILHARGSQSQAGKVEVHKLSALDRMYHNKTFHELI